MCIYPVVVVLVIWGQVPVHACSSQCHVVYLTRVRMRGEVGLINYFVRKATAQNSLKPGSTAPFRCVNDMMCTQYVYSVRLPVFERSPEARASARMRSRLAIIIKK